MTIRESRPSTRRAAGLVAALVIAIAACGGSDDDADGGSTTGADGSDAAAVATAPADPLAAPTGENVPTPAQAAESEELPEQEAIEEADGEPVAIAQETGPITVNGDPLAPFDPGAADAAVGSAAPVVEGQGFDGTAMSIGGSTENPTMVVFLAHWCPHCNDEIPELLSLRDGGSLPEGLDVVAVSTAADETRDNYPPSEWFVEKGWPWPVMLDDPRLTALGAMGGTGFPFTVILDSDGNVLGRRGGSATADQILEFVNGALA